MYNGIGMSTSRGSGTNGYVVKNLSVLRPKRARLDDGRGEDRDESEEFKEKKMQAREKMESEILEHEYKRKIELECIKLQDELEDKGMEEDLVEEAVDKLRNDLLERYASGRPELRAKDKSKVKETHEMSELKKKQIDSFGAALRIPSNYVEGMGFDRELVELRKQQKKLEYEEREAAAEKAKLEKDGRRG
ncbi:Serine/arginine repetitive matrix protein 2, partial [Smittium culicis]